jgi:LacI family transcriptional regulator, gluconate utilization system Gnt-I transcriptional repressor
MGDGQRTDETSRTSEVEEAEPVRRGGARARMDDVAALAGVTKMTVSRYLREPARVAPATRERIEAAVRALGYLPNYVAGSLKSQRTRVIAVLVPTIQHSVFADTIQGLADVCRPHGYHLMLADTDYSAANEDALIDAFLGRRPDAMVLTGITRSPGARARLGAAGIPIVETWELSDTPIDTVVGYSNEAAAHAMTTTLAQRGYRRIAFVSRPTAGNERTERREQGYRRAVAELGLPELQISTIGATRQIVPEDGGHALLDLLSREPGVDAVFFTNDVYAVGALAECRRRGIAVPRLGIAGFHDLDIARMVSPTLTSVHVPAYAIGQRTGELLMRRLSGATDGPRRFELPVSVVERESTAR